MRAVGLGEIACQRCRLITTAIGLMNNPIDDQLHSATAQERFITFICDI